MVEFKEIVERQGASWKGCYATWTVTRSDGSLCVDGVVVRLAVRLKKFLDARTEQIRSRCDFQD